MPQTGYCFNNEQPAASGEVGCLTEGTVLTSIWNGVSQRERCLVGSEPVGPVE